MVQLVKNQYFGDMNDYRKYGVLRALSQNGRLSMAICWMLTPDDGRSDGGFTQYLDFPKLWRYFDPELFNTLRQLVIVEGMRDVSSFASTGFLRNARFYNTVLTDDREQRSDYFARFWEPADRRKSLTFDVEPSELAPSIGEGMFGLVFFDPDNGLEVKSVPLGRKHSSKYLYWPELIHAYRAGYSVLVYQHFPRKRRNTFVSTLAGELVVRAGCHRVWALRTTHVVFFLLPQRGHRRMLSCGLQQIATRWAGQIFLECISPAKRRRTLPTGGGK